MDTETAYKLGRLLALIEYVGELPTNGIAYTSVINHPREFAPLIARVKEMGRGNFIEEDLKALPAKILHSDIPLENDALKSFDMGYNDQKTKFRRAMAPRGE